MAGFDINWTASPNAPVTKHPLYQKYNMLTFAEIAIADVKGDLAGVLATTGSTAICAYLAWLIRTLQFLEE